MACIWTSTGKSYIDETTVGLMYSDVIQGSFKNCHLIAALSSLAWINNNFFSRLKVPPAEYTFNFQDTDPVAAKHPGRTSLTPPITVPVCVNSLSWMDGLVPCGSSSKNSNEIWPAMYEKAFAKFCQWKFKRTDDASFLTLDQLKNSKIDPAFSSLPNGSDWGGNPAIDLQYLTGRSCLRTTFLTTDNSFTFSQTKTTPYDFIKYLCDAKVVSLMGRGTYNGAKIRYPMGAWTYLNENDAKTKAGVTITYDQATLPADHCFSVLGVYENNGKQYIALRNPYGRSDADASKFSVGPGPWIFSDKKFAIGNLPLTTDLTGTDKRIDFSIADGIFALEAADFSRYFAGFGFIS
jgi:hypothetical protein